MLRYSSRRDFEVIVSVTIAVWIGKLVVLYGFHRIDISYQIGPLPAKCMYDLKSLDFQHTLYKPKKLKSILFVLPDLGMFRKHTYT